MNLQENINRIKSIMNINEDESQTITLQQYMDELLRDPIAFLNKLSTDDQFKNAYIKSYGHDGGGNPNYYILQDTKVIHIINNGGKTVGQIKDEKTGEVLENYEITTVDEFLKLRQKITDSKATERPLRTISNSGLLESVKNGKEVAQSLNVPFGGDVVFR
jgi:hypothetical protein